MARLKTMQPKANVAGRSFVFNLIFVALNVAAVAVIVMGFHRNFKDDSTWLLLLGISLFLFSGGALIIFKGRMMLNNFSRVFVGSLFIVSGLVKANDPIGFSYKLQEYFEDGALAYRIKEWFGAPEFSLEWFGEIALSLSVIICVLEIVLGVLTIFRQKMKWVSVLILGMMVFFTFLTWHTANCDSKVKFLDRDRYALNDPIGLSKVEQAASNEDIKVVSQSGEIVIDEMAQPQCVSDCGCFGDALKGSVGRSLTPSESLWKDLVLLYFSIWLVAAAFKSNTVEEEKRTLFWTFGLIFIGFLSWVFGWVFPVLFALILFLGTVWLLRNEREKANAYWKVILFVTFISGLIITYVLLYEPIKDYRPYAIGSNLKDKMNDGIEGKDVNTILYKNISNGKERSYLDGSTEYTSSKIWEDKNWEYVDMVKKEIIPAKLPSISIQFGPFVDIDQISNAELSLPFVRDQMLRAKVDAYQLFGKENDTLFSVFANAYSLENYPEDLFEIKDTTVVDNPEFNEILALNEIFSSSKLIVLSVNNLADANWSSIDNYKSILNGAQKMEIPMIMLSSSSDAEINDFREKNDFEIPIFRNDETELKAIARSNPSLMILRKGIVVGKYPHRAMPDFDWLIKNDLK